MFKVQNYSSQEVPSTILITVLLFSLVSLILLALYLDKIRKLISHFGGAKIISD